MKRFLSPFVLIFTAVLCLGWFYAVSRLDAGPVSRFLIAVPFVMVWSLPVLYWGGALKKERKVDHVIHITGYLSMAFLSFFMLFLLLIDAFYFVLKFTGQGELALLIDINRSGLLYGLTLFAMGVGLYEARYGPAVRRVVVPLPDLPIDLDGFTIVQITDLHIGPTIHKDYVQRVVDKTRALNPDLLVITGDMVDGPVHKLLPHAEPLKEFAGKAYLSLGNHDYYSGADEWTRAFREMGLTVLINEHVIIRKGSAQLLLAGVTDPAAMAFDKNNVPSANLALSRGEPVDRKAPLFKMILAHNPRLARHSEKAGFDLQLSGHTHAGQFIPWTLVVKMVHRPHYWGLSEEGKMKVYVGAGTGTWGPPIRFGTRPELTLLTLSKHH